MKRDQIYIGIDASKGYSDFILYKQEKVQLETGFQLDDNFTGHEILIEKITKLTEEGFCVICGIENTGGYERNWVKTIKKLSKKNDHVEIYKLNPRAVKHQIQSMMKRTVNDSVSAEGIAMYMINNYEVFKDNWVKSISESEETTEEKMLNNMIHGLLKQRTMKKNQLEKVLYQSFPEILKDLNGAKWVYLLLKKYPSAAAVKRAKLAGLQSIRGISERKAIELKERARNSVAALSGEIPELIVSKHCEYILSLSEEIDELKNILIKSYDDNEDVQLLTNIQGIGSWTAVSFYIELGDPTRFDTASQLASFFGVNPTFKQSGDGIYKSKMSKQGSPRMRAVLYLMAHNLFMQNDYFKNIYAGHRAKGKTHRVVMGILMHKILRVAWGMIKSKTEFDPGVDIKNQEKNQDDAAVEKPLSEKSRRLQELSLDAPISKRNKKKRKAMLEPQPSTMEENTRSEHSQSQT